MTPVNLQYGVKLQGSQLGQSGPTGYQPPPAQTQGSQLGGGGAPSGGGQLGGGGGGGGGGNSANPVQDFINQSQSQNAPYDAQYQAQVNAALRKQADLQAQHDMGYGNAQSDYDYSNYLIGRNLATQQRGNIDQYGANGTIHSSIYSNAANETDQQAQDRQAAAALRRSQAQAGYDLAERSGQTDLLNMVEGGQADAAGRAAQAAYQRQLDAQQAQYQRDTLDLARQGNESQRNSLMQQNQIAQQQAAQQQDYYRRLMQTMQPTTYPTGQMAPSGGNGSPYPSDYGQQLQNDINQNSSPYPSDYYDQLQRLIHGG